MRITDLLDFKAHEIAWSDTRTFCGKIKELGLDYSRVEAAFFAAAIHTK